MSDVLDLDLSDAVGLVQHARSVARSGGDKTECPVGPSDPHWSAWQSAWARTRCNMEQQSGAMGYRTALMKAEVRRQTEHLSYTQPDPCADVIDPPQQLSVAIRAAVSPFFKSLIEAASQAEQAFQQALNAMTDVFNAMAPTLADPRRPRRATRTAPAEGRTAPTSPPRPRSHLPAPTERPRAGPA